MNVRPAKLSDLPRILEIERNSETAPHWSEGDYLRILEGATGVRRRLFIAERSSANQAPIGFAVASLTELESVAVDPPERRQGAGRALCLAAIQWTREQGTQALELEVRVSSHGAIDLYRSLGFTETGRRPRYYQEPVEDAVLMRLSESRATAS